MKIYIQTNKATTNIFGLHTQPRKTTRYPNKLKLASGGGGEGKRARTYFTCDNFSQNYEGLKIAVLATLGQLTR